jgi:ribonuclease HI
MATINTDGSAINNGWENATAGISVWYADGNRRNISMKLTKNRAYTVPNSRAELGAILEALRQNEGDDLEIEPDSPARTTFKWVKGHANNYGNNQADTPANEGRISNSSMRVDEEEWLNSHPVLQDGARLQTLEAKNIYDLLIKWYTRTLSQYYTKKHWTKRKQNTGSNKPPPHKRETPEKHQGPRSPATP